MIEYRIGVVKNHRAYGTVVHVVYQRGHAGIVALAHVAGCATGGGATVAQRLVDGRYQRLHGWVVRARYHKASAAGGFQLGGGHAQRGFGIDCAAAYHRVVQCQRRSAHCRRLDGHAHVGVGAGEREGSFELEVTRHAALGATHLAGSYVLAGVLNRRNPAAQEVSPKAHDNAGFAEVVAGYHAAIGLQQGRGRVRVVHDVRGIGIAGREFRNSLLRAGADNGGRDDGDAARGTRQLRADFLVDQLHLGRLAFDGKLLETAAVVKAQHGSLCAGRKPALGDGRLRVAFELNWAAIAGLHQHGIVVSPVEIGGGVEVRNSRVNFLGLVQVRNRLFYRRFARGQHRSANTKAHQLEEIAAGSRRSITALVAFLYRHELGKSRLHELRGAFQFLNSFPVLHFWGLRDSATWGISP